MGCNVSTGVAGAFCSHSGTNRNDCLIEQSRLCIGGSVWIAPYFLHSHSHVCVCVSNGIRQNTLNKFYVLVITHNDAFVLDDNL